MAILAPLLIQDEHGSELATTTYDRLPDSPCYLLEPGHALRVRSQQWTDGRFLMFEVAYHAPHHSCLQVRFYAKGEEEARLAITYGFIPGLPARLAIDLKHLRAQTLFLPRSPGILKATCLGRRIDLNEVDRAEIEVLSSAHKQMAFIAPPRLATDQPFCPVKKQTLTDELGQLEKISWGAKVESVARSIDLIRKEAEASDRALPRDWSAYGGSRQHTFERTGWFHTHHDGDRWWLVDPDGCGFFSTGIDGITDSEAAAIVPGTEELFGWLPKRDSEFGDAIGDHAAWSMPTVNFGRCNLRRAFGDDWHKQWSAMTRKRMQRWRFNTIANWSDPQFYTSAAIPYVVNLKDYPTTAVKLYRDLPDVFDPTFERNAQVFAAQLAELKDDRTMIGYFMANEPKWAFGDADLASEMLEANPGSHAREALVDHLKQVYNDDSAAWTTAWGLPPVAFDVLNTETFHRLADTHPGAREDLDAFSRILARRYADIPAAACRAVDPNHLNLGLRFAFISSPLCYEVASSFDLFSINCYKMMPDTECIETIAERLKLPVIIGEFHFGALDAGLYGTGLRGVETQVERGIAYRNYVEACAAHPAVVGCHYFQWNDQPGLGRFDGECWQIGFVDICQQPYKELVHAATMSNERIYKVRTGKVEPFRHDVHDIPRIAF